MKFKIKNKQKNPNLASVAHPVIDRQLKSVNNYKIKKMKEKTKWTRIIYTIGVIALIIGVLDPLEGSVVLAAGCALIALSTYLTHDRHRKIFLASMIMIVIGVFFLFYFSTLGGFGGTSTLSWWWITLILPYPLGWLLSIITLIVRAVNKSKQQANT